jgi:hypothetical protein
MSESHPPWLASSTMHPSRALVATQHEFREAVSKLRSIVTSIHLEDYVATFPQNSTLQWPPLASFLLSQRNPRDIFNILVPYLTGMSEYICANTDIDARVFLTRTSLPPHMMVRQ